MTESLRLSDLMTRVMHGHPWHAASIADLLGDVTVAEAKARPVSGVHTIWELVLHLTGWANEVRRRLEGREAGGPAGGNWPRVGEPTAARWRASRAALTKAYRKLDTVIAALTDQDLRRPVVDYRNSVLGTGLSRYVTAHGAVHHAVYHAGQIAMLKKALRS